MARNDDIELNGATRVLYGLAADLAVALRARADLVIAEPVDLKAIDGDLRAITLIARAGIAVQALQTAEDKAGARAREANAQRALATARALNPKPHTPDEGDETDMHERDPRLETAEGVAEIYQDARRGVDSVFRCLELKRDDRSPGHPGGGVGAVEQLDRQGERPTAPAH